MIKNASQVSVTFMPIGNRNVNRYKVQRIKDNMLKYGITSGISLIKTSLFDGELKYYAADGQHRYIAAKELNILEKLPVFIIETELNTVAEIIKFVSDLNAVQTPWSLENYVNAFASAGNENYITLKAKTARYNISYILAGIIYSGYQRDPTANRIKAGTFAIINENKADIVASFIRDLIPIFGRSWTNKLNAVALALYNWDKIESCDHKKLVKYIERNKKDILAVDNTVRQLNIVLGDFRLY